MRFNRVYLNSAKYLKVGQTLWVDRVFANAVVNGMYSFHASASAYTEFWNNSFKTGNPNKISRWHIWQAFVQESIRSIAAISNINLQLQDGLAIDDVTKEAFSLLGENGLIHAADQHTCGECTQPYKETADIMPGVDPAGGGAVLGQSTANAMQGQASTDENMDIDHVASVKMVVVDGIVMGPAVCDYFNIYIIADCYLALCL